MYPNVLLAQHHLDRLVISLKNLELVVMVLGEEGVLEEGGVTRWRLNTRKCYERKLKGNGDRNKEMFLTRQKFEVKIVP